jgi:cell division protein FtsW
VTASPAATAAERRAQRIEQRTTTPIDPTVTRRRRARRRENVSQRRSGRAFLLLLAVVVVLNLVGLVMVLSASSVVALHENGSSWYYFIRQAIWLAVGGVALVIALRVDYHRWQRWARPVLLVSLGLLVLVLAVGVEVNGSKRWLGIADLGIQPSEFAKFAVILFAADLLARRSDRMARTDITLRPLVVVLVVTAGLIMLQPNLGTTLIVCSIVLIMLFVAGTPMRSLGSIAAIGMTGALALAVAAPYRRSRMLAFLDPWKDPQNTGFQTIQSLVGTASGGLFGVGLGASRAKWGFLPFAHTDFIFAIIAEELGLIGALLVLGLFLGFGVLGVSTALRAPDLFGTLLATGVTAWITVQAVVNIGAVLGVLPITGVPLPFVSFGGSSMVATMFATGVLLNVARQAR